MRLFALSLVGLLMAGGAHHQPVGVADLEPPALQEQTISASPAVEQILVPIYGNRRGDPAASGRPYWAPTRDLDVFREIRALSRDGLVATPGQPPPKLKVLSEFFSPAPGISQEGLLGHYVFVVECTRSDLKNVYALTAR